MSLQIGQQLGSYEIKALLGKGGMGEVYRACDVKLKRDVAIKVLPDSFSEDAARVSRFQREAEVLGSLNHPHIAAIYHLEEAAGVPLLVLELVEGETLAERIARGPIPITEALVLAKYIADALEGAHEKGIVHRDLKPANIKVRPDGVVKVLDFGLAKTFTPAAPLTGSQPTAAETRAGLILGTPAYMSPEQACGRAVDKRTDIWAFGCVLYEMLAHRSAFERSSVTETIGAILEHEPDWAALPRTTPAAVQRFLRRCLHKDPKNRFHDIADIRLELDDVAAGKIQTQPEVRRHSRYVLVTTGLFAIISTFLAAVVWNLWRDRPALPVLRFEVSTPPVPDPVSLFSFALSPDGRQFVYVGTVEQRSQLLLRQLDQTTSSPLPGTEGATYPFWSPDSRSVAFFADGLLKRLDLGGSKPQILANARNPMGGSWNRDGDIVFAPFSASPLMVAPAKGGPAKALTELATRERSHRFPTFLPDGRRFLFLVQFSEPGIEGVHLGSLDSPHAHQRLVASDTAPAYAQAGYLLIGRQNVLLAVPFDEPRGAISGEPVTIASNIGSRADAGASYSISQTGLLAHRAGERVQRSQQMVWMDRKGVMTHTKWSAGFVNLAPDGQQAAATRYDQGNFDIYIFDSDRSTRFTFDSAIEIFPLWSRDGKRLVFSSNRRGNFDVFEKPLGMTQDEQALLTSSDNEFPVDWSPDGRVILFVKQDSEADDDVWALPLDGNRTAFPVVEGPFAEDQAQFSPDGRWIAYRSNGSGRREIYVQAFPGPGGLRQISKNGGIQPRWRRDGKELFYIEPDNRMVAVPIRLSVETQTIEVGAPSFLFTARFADLNNAQPAYGVAPDGRFLVDTDDKGFTTPPITIVQNWMAALKK